MLRANSWNYTNKATRQIQYRIRLLQIKWISFFEIDEAFGQVYIDLHCRCNYCRKIVIHTLQDKDMTGRRKGNERHVGRRRIRSWCKLLRGQRVCEMRLDMLIRLIMRALCRGAYQQCVRYCGTGVLLPPHLRAGDAFFFFYHAISEPLFHACSWSKGREEKERSLRDRALMPYTGGQSQLFFRINSLMTFLLVWQMQCLFENVYR